MPNFWVALILIVVFVVDLDWFPLSGMTTIGGPDRPARARARHRVAPRPAGPDALADVHGHLHAPDARRDDRDALRAAGCARPARGACHRSRVVRGHIARPALLPVVTMLGLQAGAMLGGSVVIETVFAIPGLGSLAYLAVQRRDLPLVAGVVLAGTVLVIVINLRRRPQLLAARPARRRRSRASPARDDRRA